MPRNPNKIDYSKGLPEQLHAFEALQDPRTGGRTLHHFGEIIFMALTCIVCGVKSYELIVTSQFKVYHLWSLQSVPPRGHAGVMNVGVESSSSECGLA